MHMGCTHSITVITDNVKQLLWYLCKADQGIFKAQSVTLVVTVGNASNAGNLLSKCPVQVYRCRCI